MNLASVLLEQRSHTPAMTADTSTLGYDELADAAARAAGGLTGLGVAPGERVAIVAGNTPTFVIAYLATLWAGGIAVPLDPHSGVGELRRRLAAVAPRVAVVDPAGRETYVAAAAEAGEGAEPVVVAVGGEITGGETWDTVAAGNRIELVERADDEVAVLLFTAGTGGLPKAAMLTHGNLATNIRQVLGHPGLVLHDRDVGLGSLPLFHVFGLNVALGVTLAAGAHLILVEHFDPAATAALIAERKVTIVAGVPAMFDAWLATDAPSDAFATVRLAVSGAAPLPAETARAFAQRFGVVVHEGYGLTEASPIVTTAAVSGEPHPGSIGPPLPGVEVQLVDVADGTAVLPGDPGEIWVRGPNVFPGYWEAPDATEAVFSPDDWLRTGDIAVADESGWLRIVDRFKDLVIVSGFNVYPAEVETVLLTHPDVAEAAVVGEPDPRTGERLVAFVVPTPGHEPDPAALTAWTARQLARYKCPTRFEIVEELPRSFVGKLLRRELRAGGLEVP